MVDDYKRRIWEFILLKFPQARKHKIGVDDSLLDSKIVDSLGVLEIITFLTENLGIEIEEDDLIPAHFQTITAIYGLVLKKTQVAAGKES